MENIAEIITPRKSRGTSNLVYKLNKLIKHKYYFQLKILFLKKNIIYFWQ